eukprot:TRINITY_DN1449_c0_g2_i1.p1 TRINITY_DN1449_c0_g2~~TRINITY_DN1449_c0_g2_i1.p1  ORF type:complete len:109 (-),score=18.58 TRINITY_DN1449_c0_g2_i1:177-503(-)
MYTLVLEKYIKKVQVVEMRLRKARKGFFEGNPSGSAEVLCEAFAFLGVDIPKNPTAEQIAQASKELQDTIKAHTLDSLWLKEVETDKKNLTLYEIFFDFLTSAYCGNQ